VSPLDEEDPEPDAARGSERERVAQFQQAAGDDGGYGVGGGTAEPTPREILLEAMGHDIGGPHYESPGAEGRAERVRAELLQNPVFLDALDRMLSGMDESQASTSARNDVLVKTATGVSLTLSAGFLSWLLRAGSLMASALSSMPLWKAFDPLPVLAAAASRRGRRAVTVRRDDEEDDAEGVAELFDHAPGGERGP